MEQAVGWACGKVILIGEHAVVHGQPAIAMPFPRVAVKATVCRTDGPLTIASALYQGPLAGAPRALHGIAATILETMKRLDIATTGVSIRLDSTIPPGRGLGSSAAVAAAVVRGLFAYQDLEPAHAELMGLTHIAEVSAHGTPSGIDSEAVVAEAPLWFVKGSTPIPLPAGAPLHLVVADSGRMGDTLSAVAAVRAHLQSDPASVHVRLAHLGHLAHAARAALAGGDLERLGCALDEAQAVLADIGVSDEHLEHFIQAARQAGALGAKLTGSGRGGCILALARDPDHAQAVAAALSRAGAHSVWQEVYACRRRQPPIATWPSSSTGESGTRP
jgi:mevalonate kinase